MFPKFRLSDFFMSGLNFQSQSDNSGGSGSSGDNSSASDNQSNDQGPKDFEGWLNSQTEEVKKVATPLFQAHVNGLMATVKATRGERDTFAKQLRDASKKLEEGSAQKVSLEKMADDLDKANKRADFMEEAPGQGCKNPKAAYAIASANDLFTKAGAPDWKAIQSEAPELFGSTTIQKGPVKRSAGSGSGQEPVKNQGVNDWIRKQAGVQISDDLS